jgi:hypothetical protein
VKRWAEMKGPRSIMPPILHMIASLQLGNVVVQKISTDEENVD